MAKGDIDERTLMRIVEGRIHVITDQPVVVSLFFLYSLVCLVTVLISLVNIDQCPASFWLPMMTTIHFGLTGLLLSTQVLLHYLKREVLPEDRHYPIYYWLILSITLVYLLISYTTISVQTFSIVWPTEDDNDTDYCAPFFYMFVLWQVSMLGIFIWFLILVIGCCCSCFFLTLILLVTTIPCILCCGPMMRDWFFTTPTGQFYKVQCKMMAKSKKLQPTATE